MRTKILTLAAITLTGAALAVAGQDEFGGFTAKKGDRYGTLARTDTIYRLAEAIRRCAGMVGDSSAQREVQRVGLNLMNLTWEDTGRYKGSSVGPNISDMTIQVLSNERGRSQSWLMPVIRHPNFSDLTGDMDPRGIALLVGNQNGGPLRRTSLHDVLADPGRFLSDRESWPSRRPTLLAPRDSKVLVSAQACFLPVPGAGKATFNPVLFNYQSAPGNPGVLTILATREGTSMTIIDNSRDSYSAGWGQRLFHNADGERASLTGERLSDYIGRGGDADAGVTVPTSSLNMVMLIQVPLKQREDRRYKEMEDVAASPSASGGAGAGAKKSERGTENAVIGHGEVEGPFTEMDGLAVERDTRFPVRVTVQFYKATETGELSRRDAQEIKADIDRVYRSTESVGSLVTGGRTGRVTEYDGCKVQPAEWWSDFWHRYESWSGVSRAIASRRLRIAIGEGYERMPVSELYLRDNLRTP